ncbi:MAG: hypothetical protein ACR2MB_12225 [Acidimicrobiales bacterium]
MTATPIITDVHANRYAPVHVEELDEWAWLLGRVKDWLLHAPPDTVEDCNDFTGPGGPRINDVIYVLGHWTVRMRALAEGRP